MVEMRKIVLLALGALAHSGQSDYLPQSGDRKAE